MNIEPFAGLTAELCAHSLVVPDRPLRWTIIANPGAGGFTISGRWKKHHEALKAAARTACNSNARRENSRPSQTALAAEGNPGELSALGLVATRHPGHAGSITGDLLREAAEAAETAGETPAKKTACPPFYLVICAGGDGTSLEVLSRLYSADPGLRDNFAVIRLPMGTANDGADFWELADALELLTLPTELFKVPALRLSTATEGKGPFLAFNILSVGLDAFVTHMTNKMKGKLPGDSYRLWVDIASLFYDRLYKVGPMEIQVFAGAEEPRILRETPLLLAVGASGRRTYGSRNLILPDDRNACLIRQTPLLRKIALKKLIRTGSHAETGETLLFNARRVEFRGREPLLAQMDGETVLLRREDFPANIELTSPAIQALKKKSRV
ncbi:MAG: diacylglycerol kinase [Spirochaetaceae bacterium]|jgi:diacylglycerol kinase family enzyme|nr:diacylglycerol kinase [Spirochaetaceae bacterium]